MGMDYLMLIFCFRYLYNITSVLSTHILIASKQIAANISVRLIDVTSDIRTIICCSSTIEINIQLHNMQQ